jgi:hypothetical protein
MKNIITNFDKFNSINENVQNEFGHTLDDLYNMGAEYITDAANLLADEGTEEWDEINNSDPSDVIDKLQEFGGQEAQDLIELIKNVEEQIEELSNLEYDEEDSDEW